MVTWRGLVAALLIPSVAAAEEPFRLPQLYPELTVELHDIPSGEDDIVVLEQGRPAPFSGQLFSNDTALRWGNWLEQYWVQTPIMLKTQAAICTAEVQYRDQVLVVRQKAAQDIQEDLTARLKKVEETNAVLQEELRRGPEWYNSRGFGIVIGMAGMLGVTALSVWAINAAAK